MIVLKKSRSHASDSPLRSLTIKSDVQETLVMIPAFHHNIEHTMVIILVQATAEDIWLLRQTDNTLQRLTNKLFICPI